MTYETIFVNMLAMSNRTHSKSLCDPAATVVRELGGVAAAAEIAGVARVQVYRWMWSEADGGTGGYIPQRRAQKLYDWAKEHGKPLPAELFFRSETVSAA